MCPIQKRTADFFQVTVLVPVPVPLIFFSSLLFTNYSSLALVRSVCMSHSVLFPLRIFAVNHFFSP